ncbi:unnamed protein product, partial [Polarella glacialis]
MAHSNDVLRMPVLDISCREEGAVTEGSPASRWQHPPSFYCPISQQCMHDPVVLSDGHTYERRHIERWLQNRNTSPVSGLVLKQKDLFPNHALRNAIDEYFQQVFSVHRHAIRKTIQSECPKSLWSNALLLRTIDALMQCSLLVNADLSTESVLRKIMDEAKTLLGAEVASVFLVDAAHQELYSTINSTGGMLRIPLTVGIAGHVASSGEPVVIHNAYEDDRFNKEVDVKTGFKTRNILCVPLKTKKGGVMGVAQLINKTRTGVLESPTSSDDDHDGHDPAEDAHFSAEDVHFLQVFASQAASAIANSGALEADEFEESGANNSVDDCRGGCCDAVLKSCFRGLLKKQLSRELKKQGVEEAAEQQADNWQALKLLDASFGAWQLDTLSLAQATGNEPLSTLGNYLFDRLGLVDHFGLDRAKLSSFLHEIERGYDDSNKYHNRSHAASVMYAMYALLEQGGLSESAASAVSVEGHSDESKKRLVTMACLIAAAVHDFEHLGLSNDFLMKTCDERALRYNDQHVNENHHAAAAFAVLHRAENNFLAGLPPSDVSFVRRLVIDMVLGTDMVDNGKILKSFVDKLDGRAPSASSSSSSFTFAPASPEEATLLLQVGMKCSDLGHLALAWDVHVQWVRRLEEEFFAQGDKEKERGLPVSFLMDRSKPGAAATQVGFFEFVVLPLFRSLVRAAPAANPLLVSVLENYQRWRDEASPPELTAAVQDAPGSSSDPASVAESSDTVQSKRKSGRSRQRAAKWWAGVRQRTPRRSRGSRLQGKSFDFRQTAQPEGLRFQDRGLIGSALKCTVCATEADSKKSAPSGVRCPPILKLAPALQLSNWWMGASIYTATHFGFTTQPRLDFSVPQKLWLPSATVWALAVPGRGLWALAFAYPWAFHAIGRFLGACTTTGKANGLCASEHHTEAVGFSGVDCNTALTPRRLHQAPSPAALQELADGPYFVISSFLDARSLGAADAACRLLRELHQSHSGPWHSLGTQNFRGLELDNEGVFERGIGGEEDESGPPREDPPMDPRRLLRVDWRGRFARFRSELPSFRSPFGGPEILSVEQADEIAYCRCRLRTDFLGENAPASSSGGVYSAYLEVEVLKNPDNVSLAVVDFEAGGCSSVTFSPDTGAVIRERKVREAPRKVEGAYIQPLATITAGQGFEGSMGLYLRGGQLAFFRRHYRTSGGEDQQDGGVPELGPWETTGFVTNLSWAEGR